MATLKDKIPAVLAYARAVPIKYGHAKNMSIGIKKIVVHAYACLIACLLRYA